MMIKTQNAGYEKNKNKFETLQPICTFVETEVE